MRCSLLQLSLDRVTDSKLKSASYKALSYVWGSATRNHEILCDGRIITVTRNCFIALKHLRLELNTRVLWVDAICIDQTSIP